ncbi:MAG TPA: acyltransferase [Paucimonas sp.]|nr:acyltransferase [Paucimonas sp.]
MHFDRTTTNNFDCIRLLAALAVFYSHQVKLMGRGVVEVSSYHDLGKTGVLVFFVMSGYLVAQSWERDPHLWRFLARRFLRIWPGLICVVLLTVFALGPLMTSLPVREYFQSPQTMHYLGHILLIIQERLPGVFTGHPIERVNGPLWTIPIEAGWYAVLAAIGVMGLLRYRFTMPFLLLACAIYVFGIYGTENQDVAPFWELEFGLFFLHGACLHYLRQWWLPRPWSAAAFVSVLAVLANALGHEYIAILIALPYFVILIAQASTPIARDAGRWGDFSYGIYIYSFPVQQTVVALSKNSLGLVEATVVSLGCAMLLAWLSWRFVEAPAIGLKRFLQPGMKSRNLENTAHAATTT